MKTGLLRLKLVCLIAVSVAALRIHLSAQPALQDYIAARWTTRDGLPSDLVTAVLRTRDGYLWVGTANGLVRFDGLRFLPITLDTAASATNIFITALCEDSAGKLWVGTRNRGVFSILDGTVQVFPTRNLLGETVTCLAAHPAGGIWVGTQAGVFLWSEGRLSHFSQANGLPDETVLGIHIAPSGNIWITTRLGVRQFKNGQLLKLERDEYLPEHASEFIGAYEDVRSNLWAFGGSFLVNLSQGRRINYFKSFDPVGTRVWTLHGDQDGVLWIGTSGRGLFRFAHGEFTPIQLRDQRQLEDIRAICTDAEGNVWVGSNGGGLARLTPAELRWLDTPTRFKGKINALAADTHNRLWVSVDGVGLFSVYEGRDEIVADPELSLLNHVVSLCVGKHGALWMGTWGSGVYLLDNAGVSQYTIKDGLPDDVVTALCAGQDEGMYASTRSGEVCRFVGRTLFRWGTTSITKSITTMLQAKSGTLWLGTEGDGIWKIENRYAPAEPGPAALRGTTICGLQEDVGSSRVDLQACKLEYSIVSPK